MENETLLLRIYAFLERIGIPFREVAIETDTFLPGLRIEQGTLEIDRDKLKYPGDVLHEAGHIALTDPENRPVLNQELMNQLEQKQPMEIGVLIWSFLAAKELDIPGEIVFHPDGYKGQGAWLLENFNAGTYIGLPLLNWLGIVAETPRGQFPEVRKWLR